jgi:hypothetical protein
MISCPRPGQVVQVHYRKSVAPFMPHHGRRGTVVISGRGKPRNHLVDLDGERVVVNAGHLRRPGEAGTGS